MEALKLGWIGLGNMGNPMTNLLKAGFEVVVFNRNRDKGINRIRCHLSS
jgi:3-hydroxyisobutyrate dehydrogenase